MNGELSVRRILVQHPAVKRESKPAEVPAVRFTRQDATRTMISHYTQYFCETPQQQSAILLELGNNGTKLHTGMLRTDDVLVKADVSQEY